MSEERLAKSDGAKLQPNSGRGRRKGDAIWRGHLVDYKEYAKSYSITQKNWEKMKRDAWGENYLLPCISIKFDAGDRVIVVDYWDYLSKLDDIDELRSRVEELEAELNGQD